MCARYQRRSDKQRIAEAFALGALDELILEAAPSYNVAPTTRQPVIVADRDTGKRSLAIMRWGLIPFWTKDAKTLGLSTINAKAETLMDSRCGRSRSRSGVASSRPMDITSGRSWTRRRSSLGTTP
jgi:putative SOS response-associated peptidase YedK